MDTKSNVRINYLDWLRALGVLFVFIYHSTRLYNFEDWNVKHVPWYPPLEIWISFASTFMMPLMFVISGASLFYAMRKSSFGKFLKDKVLRLSGTAAGGSRDPSLNPILPMEQYPRIV